ncbi:RPGR, partial [Symbiodinium sp. KB8]
MVSAVGGSANPVLRRAWKTPARVAAQGLLHFALWLLLLALALARGLADAANSTAVLWNRERDGHMRTPTSSVVGSFPVWAGLRATAHVQGLRPLETAPLGQHQVAARIAFRMPGNGTASAAHAAGLAALAGGLANSSFAPASSAVWVTLQFGDASAPVSNATLLRWATAAVAAPGAVAGSLDWERRNATMAAMRALLGERVGGGGLAFPQGAAGPDDGPLRALFPDNGRARRLPRADGSCGAASLTDNMVHEARVAAGTPSIAFAGAGKRHAGGECVVDARSLHAPGAGSPWDLPAGEFADAAVLVLLPSHAGNVTGRRDLRSALARPRVAGSWVWSPAEQAWRSWPGARAAIVDPPAPWLEGDAAANAAAVSVALGMSDAWPIWSRWHLLESGREPATMPRLRVRALAESLRPTASRNSSVWTDAGSVAESDLSLLSTMMPARLAEPAVAVQAGTSVSLALLSNGDLHSWGLGAQGQLGRGLAVAIGGTLGSLPTMRSAVPLGGWAVGVAAGGRHVLVLLSDGGVRAFGLGSSGQLGYGSNATVGHTSATLPALLPKVPLGGRALAVGAGGYHSIVTMDSGEVLPFGQNDHGQLGVGSTANRGDTPATVPASMGAMPLALAARQGTGGAAFTAVVTSAGSIILVGSAAKGQLATGGIADIGADQWKPAPPVGVLPAEGRVVAAATGSEHTVLLTAKGRLLTFGSSTSGQLGRDSTTPLGDSAEETLQQLNSIELWQPAVAVAAGGQASAAVLADGGIVTFGMGTHGMLGLGDNIAVGSGGGKFSLAQAGMVPLGKRAVEASMGEDHTLVLSDAGQVFAFGKNVHGQLGTGSTEGLGDKGKTRAILALSPIELSNSTQAWRTEVRIAPQPRDGPTSEVVVGVAMGGSHTLALLEDGRVRPFGGNAKGQLGLGTTSSVLTARDTHLPTLDVGGDVSAVAAGNAHSIVLRRDGQVFAFGFGAAGQLGYESTANVGDGPSAMPASTGAVDFGGARAVAIAAGTEHSAVILSSGLLYAFGSGSFGQLGTGNLLKVGISGRPVLAHGRVPLGSARAVAVAAGFYHTLVLLEDGTVRSFGRAFHGQLGYGNTTELGGTAATTPEHLAPVPLGGAAVALAAGFHFSAVVLADGSLRTFGRGSSGQLGYGSTANAGGAASTTPALMGPVPVGGAALAVACGGYHTIVLMLDGTVAAMGNNSQGQLGLASFPSVGADPSALPRDAGNLAVGGRAVAVAAGGGTSAGSSRSAVLLEDGTLLTFGSNTDGAIGAGSAASRGQASNWAFASLKNDASLLLADSALDRPLSRPLTAAPPYLLTMGSPSLPDMSIRTYMRSAAGVRVTPTGDWPMTAGIHFASGASPVDLAPGADAATQACAIGVAGQVLGSSSVACGFEDARLWHAFDAAPTVSSVSLAVNGVESTEVDAKGDPTAELRFSVAGDFHWAALELGLGATGGAQEAAACDASAEALQAFSSWGGGFVTAELQTRAVAAGAGAIPSCRLLSTAELQCFGQVLGARSNESDPMAVVLSPRCSAQQFRSVSIVPLRFPGPAVVSAWLEDDGASLQVLGRGFGSGSAALPVINVNGSGECLPVVRHSDSELACSLGPGVGVDQPVVLHIDGMVASGAAAVTFPAPEIISVSPEFILAGERGVNVTVTGRHLLLTSVPAHGNSSSSSGGGSSGGAALSIDAQLEAAAARGGGLWIGGQPCEAELIVVVPGSKMLCSGFDAPVVWPEARTVRVSVAGQVGVGKPGAFEGAPRPRVSFVSLTAGAGAAAEYRPGTMVSIRGSGFAPSPAGVSATVRIGGVVAAPVNTSRASQGILEVPLPSGVQGKASVVVTSAAGLLSSDAPGSAAVTVIMAPPVVAAAAVRPPGGDTFGEWLGLPASQADAGEPAPPAALNASARLTGRGFLRTGVSGVRVGPLNCSDVVVLSDTSLECTVVGIESLRGLFPAADDALPDRLFVSFEWPTAGQRVESADAWVSPDWPPVVSAVAPAIASPGDDVVVLGRRFGPSAGRPASVQIGGLACPGLQWIASTVLRCTLPAGYRLESLPDRDGDALHVRVTSALGASTTKPRAIRLSGSVAASLVGPEGGGLDPNEALVVLPSSDGDVIAVAAESGGALCIAAVGLGAQECGFDAAVADSPLALAGAGATAVTALLVGVSRQSVPRNVSVMKFPGTGVKAALARLATGEVVATLPAQVSAEPGQSGRRWVVLFAALPLTFIEAGAGFSVRATCTWVPTGQVLELPQLTGRVARLRTSLSAVDPGAGVGPDGKLLLVSGVTRQVQFRVDAGLSDFGGHVKRSLRLEAPPAPAWAPGEAATQACGAAFHGSPGSPGAAPRSIGSSSMRLLGLGTASVAEEGSALLERARPECALRLSGSGLQALPAVAEGTEGLVLSAANEWTATVPVGVSGVGAGTVSVECSAWGGLQSWSSTSSVALRTGTLGMAMSQTDGGAAGDAGGGGSGVASRQLVLSSGASGFSVVPAVELRAVVAEAPAWPVANAGGISCGVAVPSLPASTTQSGTKTRFFASVRAGPTGAIVGVVFDALGLVGVASYPQLGQPVAFSLQCEHPDAGQLPPVQVETELVGLRAAWGR